MAKCPAEDLNGFDPCPVCGALGPWYDSPPLDDCLDDRLRVVDTGDELHQVLGEALQAIIPKDRQE
jgi:hypothetical protein